ncbi:MULTISPECIES: EthD family reductase [Amycolatopsis]|uniref:EthD domain-containing protein n=2 Tax=Amycolatopsis TaxID=1813 RepID=A0A1I3RLK0_9PSEU|nr:EthD family reductase [Amycolatopsis sacchari]SFJ46181.1 conserved hypothetical protein [Amycolatopsis sacchari]
MHKIVVLYPEPADAAAFKEYYESTHLPLAAKLPGLRAMRYSFDVSGDYFAIWEGEFDDAEAAGAAMASPEGQAVQADVPNYATGGAVVLDYPVRVP